MNQRIDFTKLGGLYIYQDTLAFLQTAYSQSIDSISKIVGDKVILSGCVDQGANVTDGFIIYNGEVLPFVGGLKATNIILEDIAGNEQFDDGQQRQVYFTKRAKFGNVIPALGGFPYTELTRLPFNTSNVKAALTSIQAVFKSVLNFESSVILDGCTVSGVVGSNMIVSAGTVMFNGSLVVTPVYTGAFPAYLKDNGIWDIAEPGSGLYIKFDPHTSQRYKDVLRRASHQTGDILMSKVLPDRFDPVTGIGKWDWLGFKLSADMRGRVPVGLWFGDNGGAEEYDGTLRTIGYTDGERNHQLTIPEMPAHHHNMPGSSTGAPGTGGLNFNGTNDADVPTETAGEDEPHNNMQPYRVIAFIERI